MYTRMVGDADVVGLEEVEGAIVGSDEMEGLADTEGESDGLSVG